MPSPAGSAAAPNCWDGAGWVLEFVRRSAAFQASDRAAGEPTLGAVAAALQLLLPPPDPPAVWIPEALSFRYPGTATGFACPGGSVRVRRGEVACVIGPNGSGKTTFLKILNGEETPTGGPVLVGGHDLAALGPAASALVRATAVSFVPATDRLLPFLTVEDNVGLRASFSGLPRRSVRTLVRAQMESVGLPAGHAALRPDQLSTGDGMRVLFARALCPAPEVMLVDEMDAHADPRRRATLYGLLRQAADGGAAVVAVTHYVREALPLADRIFAIKAGALVWQWKRSAGFKGEAFQRALKELYE